MHHDPIDAATDFVGGDRRRFLSTAGRLATIGGLTTVAVSCGSDESPLASYPTPTPSGSAAPNPTPTPSPTILSVTDTDMLVLMIQLHYLQAEYYSRGVLGVPLASSLVVGTGTPGTVTGPRAVTFTDPILADFMREIAVEKIDQVVRLRAVLGVATPARPSLNLGVDDTGVFTRYGRDSNDVPAATGTAPRGTYDVYANQDRFLLGAFILEDPIVSAWRSVATLMTSNANIDVASGLMATSAHHTGLVRSQLFVRGGATGSTLRQSTTRLSDLRDSYAPVDDDRGVSSGSGASLAADINPADGDSQVYGRLPNLTINTFYMTQAVSTSGGFFPDGLSGVLRESAKT